MKISPSKRLTWLFMFCIQLALLACATGQTMVNHSFSFDTLEDSPNVEVLDYQYGHSNEYDNSRQVGIHAAKERVALGQVFPAQRTGGPIPRGDFLYVKWRIKQSGQIYEDRVDLKMRLPSDIRDCGIHFVIKGTQLYVYLIPPPGVWSSAAMNRAPGYLKLHQIYPDQLKGISKN